MRISSGVRPAPRRVMLYGIHGVGKSSWAAAAPSPIFLDIEKGSNDIDVQRIDDLNSYGDVVNALQWLLNEPHDFKTVVIDTVDWLEQLIFRDICQGAGVQTVADIEFGKGFPRAIPKWKFVLEHLEALRTRKRMGIILLSHARVEKFSNPEGSTYDRYAPDLWTNSRGEGVGNMIQEWCDEVLFACFRVNTAKEGKGFNEKTIAVGGKERLIRTSESASSLAKNRLRLPDELPMDWNAYAAFAKKNAAQSKPVAVESTPSLASPPESAVGNLAGVVVDGSSKPALTESQKQQVAEMEEAFGG